MEPRWSLRKRVAFRFAFLFAALQLFPLPFGTVPGTGWLVDIAWKLWEPGVSWIARVVLGISPPTHLHTGSSDTTWHYVQLLLVVMLATAGTAVWSLVDLRRAAYARLAAASHLVLRYYLIAALLTYGLAKVFEVQFVTLAPFQLDGRVGDMSPMGMLWAFMGASRPYTIFAGLLEVVAALLLLSRRTTLLGALLAIAAMANVVMLNCCFDVAVKLFSLRLLAFAIALTLPQGKRLLTAALGEPVARIAPLPRLTHGRELARRVAKVALVGTMALLLVRQMWTVQSHLPRPTAIDGIWAVESSTAGEWRTLIISPGQVTIRSMTDARTHHSAEVDDVTIRVLAGDQREVWHYQRDDDRMQITGRHLDRDLSVTLRREPEPLLTSRGFRWINDEPPNR